MTRRGPGQNPKDIGFCQRQSLGHVYPMATIDQCHLILQQPGGACLSRPHEPIGILRVPEVLRQRADAIEEAAPEKPGAETE
jgi:hypothetical protein